MDLAPCGPLARRTQTKITAGKCSDGIKRRPSCFEQLRSNSSTSSTSFRPLNYSSGLHLDQEPVHRTSRRSGILLHPTSLPGPFGIGDLGPAAYAFADFLVAAGQHLWQILPLNPIDAGGSPYSSSSAFAGNTLLISPELLVRDGLLHQDQLKTDGHAAAERIDFTKAANLKKQLLSTAFENFKARASEDEVSKLREFCLKHASWLDNYALFQALKENRNAASWNEWERAEISRDSATLIKLRERFSETVEREVFYQFLFFQQWYELKTYCNERGLQIIGDMPIFVAYDSADTWTAPHLFKLDGDNRPLAVAGVPPDYFSETGQLWGNPVYNWEQARAENFRWWVQRLRAMFAMFDYVRVDHFRGFSACWETPAGATSGIDGQWVEAPGRELFTALERELGALPIIAEDLGVITPEVDALRDEFGFPGMRVLQFGFAANRESIHLPHKYPKNVVAYTGTHDNDTTVGWFNSLSTAEDENEKQFCLEYLESDGKEINWDFIRAVLESEANTAIIPMQDVLGLGSEARMNRPSTTEGNWSWRFDSSALDDDLRKRLRSLTDSSARLMAQVY
ncbi:MAG TPA: 4-alpha-glucanotransferase [Pyrinomonadaceae bacterium]|nr:4-alpha-glucanotransferase [Pyrinomonadaceae bacterium]